MIIKWKGYVQKKVYHINYESLRGDVVLCATHGYYYNCQKNGIVYPYYRGWLFVDVYTCLFIKKNDNTICVWCDGKHLCNKTGISLTWIYALISMKYDIMNCLVIILFVTTFEHRFCPFTSKIAISMAKSWCI